jgi:Domain of unknown function (DUF4365)
LERPQQQITNASGRNQMRTIFESLGWAVREIPQDTDVGVDFEVEVFENCKSTGILFKVQLKSSTQSDYSRKKDVIREHVKRKHLTYYCKELTDPVILIHADVTAGRTFWLAPQLMHFPAKWLDGSNANRRAALLIPTAKELPSTIDDLIRAVGRIKLVVGTRSVLDAPIPQFLADIKEQVDENELIRELRNKSDALRLGQMQQLYRSRKYEEATARIGKILGDPDCSVEIRFWALLEKERIDYRVSAESGRVPQGALPEIHLKYASEMQQLARGGPPAIKFFALICRRAAELDLLAEKAVGLTMNYDNLVAHRSGYWALHAYMERLVLDRRVLKKFNQCLRLARYAANSPHRYALPYGLCRIPQAASMYLLRLDNDRADLAKKFAESAFQVCQLASWIAERSEDGESMALAASGAVGLSRTGRDRYINWAKATVEKIKKPSSRGEGAALIERQIRRVKGERLPGDLWGKATHEQIYTNMAIGIGIKMSDPNDPQAKLVRIGIADADPTRVLTTCRSIFVSPGPTTATERYLVERLGLVTGPKVIHCEKHRYGLMGKNLDEAYAAFQSKHCSTCPNREARPSDWKYSHQWHDREGKRLAELVHEFRARGRKA